MIMSGLTKVEMSCLKVHKGVLQPKGHGNGETGANRNESEGFKPFTCHCGSFGEEFVSTDSTEVKYLQEYISLLEEPYTATSEFSMKDPDHYSISVHDANLSTAVVVKMTYDGDFIASVNGKEIPIEPFGPYFMLITPSQQGDYVINLKYGLRWQYVTGLVISGLSLIALCIYFLVRKNKGDFYLRFGKGDMQ